jgi:sortase A
MVRRVLITALIALGAAALPSPDVSASRSKDLPAALVSIPKLKVSAKVYTGVTDRQFARGFGYWPGTARAGQRGNLVLSAHRTTGPRYLYNIDKLKKGDIIHVRQGRKVHRYRVTRSFIVKPHEVWIVNQSKTPILTMFACHPKGSVDERWVVRARLVTT